MGLQSSSGETQSYSGIDEDLKGSSGPDSSSARLAAGSGPDFPATAPAANPVFYRTYSRSQARGRESWAQVVSRNLHGLGRLGRLERDELALMGRLQREQKALPRLPFEPIDKVTYEKLNGEVMSRRGAVDFFSALQRYDQGEQVEAGPSGCDSDQCLLPLIKSARNGTVKL